MTRERLHMLTSLYENVHDACYDKCAQSNDLTFMSIQEGKCFRNCITKFSYFYPSLTANLKDASFREQDKLTEDLLKNAGVMTPDISL